MAKPGVVVSREHPLQRQWRQRCLLPFDRRLDMLVSRIRKIGLRKDGGERIRAVRGEGYVYLMAEDA